MKKLIGIVVLLILGYVFVPNLCHYFLLKETSNQDIKQNRRLYHKYAKELVLDRKNNNSSHQEKLNSLYLWFHVRGLKIDEGHDPLSKSQEWQEILDYLKYSQGR